MKPRARYKWIMEWITKNRSTDILNADFVDDYIEATNARFRPTNWGAHKCPRLGSDLSHMYKCGALKRLRLGLGYNWQYGLPKWVWVYSIKDASHTYTTTG